MGLSSEVTRKSYDGDGATVAFPTTFKFILNAHIQVVHRDAADVETTWVEGTQYTLAGAGEDAGGTVTVETTPTDYTPASGEKLVIIRAAPYTQPDALPLGGPLPTPTVVQMADRLTMLCQQLKEFIDRSIVLPVTSAFSSLTIPEPEADKILGWNSGATALENKALGNLSTDFDIVISAGDAGLPVVAKSTEDGLEMPASAAAHRTAIGAAGLADANIFTAMQMFAVGTAIDDTDVAAGVLTLPEDGNYFSFTGTEAVTSIASPTGTGRPWIIIRFGSARTLTHHATNLILPGEANITTASGDVAMFVEYGNGTWRCVFYTKATGKAVIETEEWTYTAAVALASTNGHTFTGIPSGVNEIQVLFYDVSLDDTDDILIQIGPVGGLETSGYASTSTTTPNAGATSRITSTAGFIMEFGSSAANIIAGRLALYRQPGGDVWRGEHVADFGEGCYGVGQIGLSGTLERVGVLDTGGDAFDNGSIWLAYRKPVAS